MYYFSFPLIECVFLDQSKVAFDSASESGEVPRIGLEEMLDDLNLEDQEMASDEEWEKSCPQKKYIVLIKIFIIPKNESCTW